VVKFRASVPLSRIIISDVCLEAKASPRGNLEAENLLPRPRLDVLMPHLVIIASASPRSRLFCLGLAFFIQVNLRVNPT